MCEKGIWAKDLEGKKNVSLLFIKEIECHKAQELSIRVAGADLYKIIVNDKTVFYGPSRTARGYAVLNTLSLNLKRGKNTFAVLVNSYYVANYSNVKQAPFLYMQIEGLDKIITQEDFLCLEFNERISNVQRYSFQRGFVEIYHLDSGIKNRKELETKKVDLPTLIPEFFLLPKLEKEEFGELVYGGELQMNTQSTMWNDRSINLVGNKFEGFYKDECYECISDTVCWFNYTTGKKKRAISSGEYSVFDLKRNVSGFIKLKLRVEQKAEIYVTFDERLLEERGFTVHPFRFNCCNVLKWELEEGQYNLESFEVYTLKYLQINVVKGKVIVEGVGALLIENPGAYHLSFKIQDDDLSAIVESAQNTLAQNSWDFLMDCPSRERACWTNDLYYSMQSAEMFFGNDDVIKSSVINILLDAGLEELPKGVIPMCYPSDHINGQYVPNTILWYILILCELLEKKKINTYLQIAIQKIYDSIKFFEGFENNDGLLEDLEGWIFVEWSAANRQDFVCGVNYPTNMLYYKVLKTVADTFADTKLLDKAEQLKKNILIQSYDGQFFQDNRIRENGVLELKGHISEVCQYFAFFSGVATMESHETLFNLLIHKFGVFRKRESVFPEIDGANIITGLIMRLDLLNQCGEHSRVIQEVKEIFGVMAANTHTLWERVAPSNSCNHCIASYGARILLRAMTGVEEYGDEGIVFSSDYCRDYDCEIEFPYKNGSVLVEVKNGNRTIK